MEQTKDDKAVDAESFYRNSAMLGELASAQWRVVGVHPHARAIASTVVIQDSLQQLQENDAEYAIWVANSMMTQLNKIIEQMGSDKDAKTKSASKVEAAG